MFASKKTIALLVALVATAQLINVAVEAAPSQPSSTIVPPVETIHLPWNKQALPSSNDVPSADKEAEKENVSNIESSADATKGQTTKLEEQVATPITAPDQPSQTVVQVAEEPVNSTTSVSEQASPTETPVIVLAPFNGDTVDNMLDVKLGIPLRLRIGMYM
jgi:hypothetical protein